MASVYSKGDICFPFSSLVACPHSPSSLDHVVSGTDNQLLDYYFANVLILFIFDLIYFSCFSN